MVRPACILHELVLGVFAQAPEQAGYNSGDGFVEMALDTAGGRDKALVFGAAAVDGIAHQKVMRTAGLHQGRWQPGAVVELRLAARDTDNALQVRLVIIHARPDAAFVQHLTQRAEDDNANECVSCLL